MQIVKKPVKVNRTHDRRQVEIFWHFTTKTTHTLWHLCTYSEIWKSNIRFWPNTVEHGSSDSPHKFLGKVPIEVQLKLANKLPDNARLML